MDSAKRSELIIALSLFKIQRFLRDGLRLRTACDLEIPEGQELKVQRPKEGFIVPTLTMLEDKEAGLPALIEEAYGKLDGSDRFTTVTFDDTKKKAIILQLEKEPTIPEQLHQNRAVEKSNEDEASKSPSRYGRSNCHPLNWRNNYIRETVERDTRNAFLKAWQAASGESETGSGEALHDQPNDEQ